MEILSQPKAPTAAERKLFGANAAIWAASQVKVESGEPFSFERHRYQLEPMCLDHPNVCFRKATQGGFTLIVMLRMLFAMLKGHITQGVIYLFPTDTKVGEFSQLRWTSLIDNNPVSIAQYIRRTNNIHNKRVGHASLMMRGAQLTQSIGGLDKESVALRSDPADVIVFDEKDLMPANAISKARGRLGHSELKWEWSLSNPTIPNFGIDADWEASDKRHWALACGACNHWNFLEIEYPRCLRREVDGRVIRVCVKCGRELDLDGRGEWVPELPNRSAERIGYWWSQLNSHYVDPGLILREMEDPPEGNLGDVKRLRLGLPHLDAQYGLTPEDVLMLCTAEPAASASRVPTCIGVDVMKQLYVVLGYCLRPDCYQIIACLILDGFEAFETVARTFYAEVTCIDNEPDLHAARRYQETGPGEVWLSDYIESVGSARYDLASGVVKINRTEALDQTHYVLTKPGRLRLPRATPLIRQFADECAAMAKVVRKDPLTGDLKSFYFSKGPDHFRHAFVNFLLAAKRQSPILLRSTDATPTGGRGFDLFE